MAIARPDGTLSMNGADDTLPMPPDPADCGEEAADGVDAAAIRLRQLTITRDRLLQSLAILDRYCRSPAPATLDLAIHQLNQEIGEQP